MFRLRSYDQTPPGGFPYHQAEGISRHFPSVPLIEHQAHIVSQFRRGNKLSRSTPIEALEDIDRYNCARLGNDPRWCVQTDAPLDIKGHQLSSLGPCAGCGGTVTG